jgi:hypothetical protein
MTYPSQPGYPAPQYGQPKSPQQNNLWLIGGAILVVLVIIMTVILLVVQQTAGNDSSEGGDGGTSEDAGGGDESGDDGGETGSDGGDTGGASVEMNAEACDAFDMTKFEEVYGTFIPEDTYRSASTSGGLSSLNCGFYNPDLASVNVYVTDYEDAEHVLSSVESDADYYNEEQGYELSEYTEIGDAGTMYTETDTSLGYKSINIHVALGSLDVKVYSILWEDDGLDEAAVIETLEDFIRQCETLFVDYQ